MVTALAAMFRFNAGMFRFNTVFGILAAFLSTFLIGWALGEGGSGRSAAWRWMLGVEAIPALLCTVFWVFISEIFPNRFRSYGHSLGGFTHWIFTVLITLFFPIAIGAFDVGLLFAFFYGMMCLYLIWVLTMVPETVIIHARRVRWGSAAGAQRWRGGNRLRLQKEEMTARAG